MKNKEPRIADQGDWYPVKVSRKLEILMFVLLTLSLVGGLIFASYFFGD